MHACLMSWKQRFSLCLYLSLLVRPCSSRLSVGGENAAGLLCCFLPPRQDTESELLTLTIPIAEDHHSLAKSLVIFCLVLVEYHPSSQQKPFYASLCRNPCNGVSLQNDGKDTASRLVFQNDASRHRITNTCSINKDQIKSQNSTDTPHKSTVRECSPH